MRNFKYSVLLLLMVFTLSFSSCSLEGVNADYELEQIIQAMDDILKENGGDQK